MFHVSERAGERLWRHGRARLGIVDLDGAGVQLGSKIDVLFWIDVLF